MLSNIQHEFSRREPIAGYETRELIGRGGYGEVWSAVAPGGLAKAIKIVYGDAHSGLVASELRALNRVKDVRHPLLLSLERAEIVGGNLVLVTELADQNLKQCFESYRGKQLPGIPQQEILGLCRDVADALDYMYSEYSLQHLDVKPENILLLGNRAKVGDYGLVKHLYERSCSMIGGLTPTYSPPELFEGKPTHFSDQYSLAIVYMQMLTGDLPFIATNTAQLATHHLKSVPDLSSLPPLQRPIIARAMSKDPSQRYRNCREMIDALQGAVEPVESSAAKTSRGKWEEENRSSDDALRSRQSGSARSSGENRVGPKAGNNGPARAEGAAGPSSAAHLGPMVIIGVGSTGGRVVHRFFSRVADRIAPVSECGWLQGIVIDTDAKELNAILQDGTLTRDVQTVPIPLQRPEAYTGRSNSLLQWLDRRWFYNIPRNLATGGFRPLARLALVTNAGRVTDAVSRGITKAFEAAPDQGSIERIQLPFFPEHGHVILVGSISGGTASGSILDLAYLVRTELKKRHLHHATVHGLLLHSTPLGNSNRDKAIVNACAMLRELNHYSRPGNCYAGEASLGVPPFHGDNAPFHSTFLSVLGEDCPEAEWRAGIDRVAEALFCSTLTAASGRLGGESESGRGTQLPRMRSLHALPLSAGTSEIIDQLTMQAGVDVLTCWREGRSPESNARREGMPQRTALLETISLFKVQEARTSKSDGEIRATFERFGITTDKLVRRAEEIVKMELGADSGSNSASAKGVVEEAMRRAAGGGVIQAADIGGILEILDRVLLGASDESRKLDPLPDSLYERLVARLSVRENKEFMALLEWMSTLVDVPEKRIDGSRHVAMSTIEVLQKMQGQLLEQAAGCRERSLQVGLQLRDPESAIYDQAARRKWLGRRNDVNAQVQEMLVEYAGHCVKKTVLNAVWKQLRVIEAEIGGLLERLNELSRQLSRVVDRLQRSLKTCNHGSDDRAMVPAAKHYYRTMVETLMSMSAEITRKVESEMDAQVLGRQGGLSYFLESRGEVGTQLVAPLGKIARETIMRRIGEMNRALLSNKDAGSQTVQQLDIRKILNDIIAGDECSGASGGRQFVVVVPDGVDASALSAGRCSDGADAIYCSGRTDEITLCCVGPEESPHAFADRISRGIPLFDDLAGRVLTRVDVNWDPMNVSDAIPVTANTTPCSDPLEMTHTAPIADLGSPFAPMV